MQISDIIKTNSNSYSSKEEKTIAIAIDDKKIDLILDDNKNLFHPDYRGWHAKWIKTHGAEIWLRCASTAKQEGRNPQRHMTWLLNRNS